MKRILASTFFLVSHLVHASIFHNTITEETSLLGRARSSLSFSESSDADYVPVSRVNSQTSETSQSYSSIASSSSKSSETSQPAVRTIFYCEQLMNKIYACDGDIYICCKKNCEEISSQCALRNDSYNFFKKHCCTQNESSEQREINNALCLEVFKTYCKKYDNKPFCFCLPSCKACCCFPIGRPDLHDDSRVQNRRIIIDAAATCVCCTVIACTL